MLKTRNEPNEWLSIHYQCTIHHRQNKSLLLRWIMKVKIRTILELLWKTWNDSLTDFQVGLIFDPAGVLLDEWGWNWNALKKVYGKDFIKDEVPSQRECLKQKLEGAHTEFSVMKTLSLLKKLKRICLKHLTQFIFIALKTNFGSGTSWLSFHKSLNCLC